MAIKKSIKNFIKACLPHGLISLIQIEKKENHLKILEKLYQDYSSIIAGYKNRNDITVEPQSPYPVWVCWWQGEAAMPEIVKICYSRLLNKANGHKINLITKDNYKDFISLPEYILEKVDKKYITLTHLSDIIRAALLSKYGGLWIDSTVYTFHDLPDIDNELFSLRRLRDNDIIAECRWTSFLLYAGKSRMLFDFLQDIFLAYWKNNNKMIHNLLIDYCITLAYEHIPELQKQIKNIPFSNPYVHWLGCNMNLKYDEQSFLYLKNTTQFCKLTYKRKYKEKTAENFLTYYGFIKNNA